MGCVTPSQRDSIFVSEQNGAVQHVGRSAEGERRRRAGRAAGVTGGGDCDRDKISARWVAGRAAARLQARGRAVPASACRSACPRCGPTPRFHGDGGAAAALVAAAWLLLGPWGRASHATGLGRPSR